MLQLNDTAPDINLYDETGARFKLSDRRGQRLLLVFYPGDNTPVCTRQLCDYRDGIESFSDLGVEVVGVSPDDAESHLQFKKKFNLPFILLSDTDLTVAERYDCKGILGMKRGVFLIDGKGKLRYIHVEAVALFRRRREELLEVISTMDQ